MKARSKVRHIIFVLSVVACIGQCAVSSASTIDDRNAGPPKHLQVPSPDEPGSCLTAEEIRLASLVNQCRRALGLPDITVSRSLTMVAQSHVRDLHWNSPDSGTDHRGLNCNLHSWSNRGEWTPACYTSDHLYRNRMWFKPEEITQGAYTDYGFEIAFGAKMFTATAENALQGWMNNQLHNNVIVEQGPWQGYRWPAMGIGIYQGYAAIWFGKSTDPLGTVPPCDHN